MVAAWSTVAIRGRCPCFSYNLAIRRTRPLCSSCKPLTGALEGKIKLCCTARSGRSFSRSWSWNRSRNSRTAVTLGRPYPKPRSKHWSPLSRGRSSGHSSPTAGSRDIDSMNWAAKNPRWRLRRVRLAPVHGGKPKARKARETLSAPAGGRGAAMSQPAPAFAQGEVGACPRGQAQGTEGARNAQRPGRRAGRLAQRPLVQDEGRLVRQRQARRHGRYLLETYRCWTSEKALPTALS